MSYIADEIYEVQKMLLQYERAANFSALSNTEGNVNIQSIDMALQVLADVEVICRNVRILESNDASVYMDFIQNNLNLERSRVKVLSVIEGKSLILENNNRKQVELF